MLSRRALLAGVGAAVTLPALGAPNTHYVRYGDPGALDVLQRRRVVVARVLGPAVAQALTTLAFGTSWMLVYPRTGDRASTSSVAKRHDQLMVRHGIRASVFSSSESEATHSLERQIEAHVKRLRRAGRVASDEVTSWAVYDIAADRYLASVNIDHPRQAASMIKPLIMLAFFSEVSRGRFIYGPVSRSKLAAMIQHSDNSATNWAIDQIGGPSEVHRLLHERYGSLVPGARVVERIEHRGKTYRNQASAGDYVRYLRALWHGALPSAVEQLRLLRLPGRDRLYTGAPSIPQGTLVYNKTGTTSMLIGDMGLLAARQQRTAKRLPYAVVGIIQKSRRTDNFTAFSQARGDVIRSVSDLAYQHLQKQYTLA